MLKSIFLTSLISILILLQFTSSGCIKKQVLDPNQLFIEHVMDPIPQSVKNIKVDQPSRTWGYRYTFRFNISRDDITKLVASRPFKKIINVKCNYLKDGDLHWQWNSTQGVTSIIYHPKSDHKKPEWFQLDLWKYPEAYAFVKSGNKINEDYDPNSSFDVYTYILLFNEKEGEAYFIASKMR